MLAALFGAVTRGEPTVIPESWRQGRTTFGGLSASIATHAACVALGDDVPLRSAHYLFPAPLEGETTARAQLLRRGRSAAFVSAEVSGGAGIGVAGHFVFAAARPSVLDHAALPIRPFLEPDDEPRRYPEGVPAFFRNFRMSHALPAAERRPGEFLVWARLVDPEGISPLLALILLADSLPPASITLLKQAAPVGTMSWQLDLLSEAPASDDGWWLLGSTVAHAADGLSNQRMTVWNRALEPMAIGMQTVAIFA